MAAREEYRGLYVVENATGQGGIDLTDNFKTLADVALAAPDSTVIVPRGEDDAESGQNLKDAYAAAKLLTPGGNALSTVNRATVLIYPGRYDFDDEGLTLDTQYVDLLGLAGSASTVLTAADETNTKGTIRQTADDVYITGVTIRTTSDVSLSWDDTNPAAYFPDSNLSETRMTDVVMESAHDVSGSWSMRMGINYSGSFTNCTAGYASFSGNSGVASGTFVSCSGGTEGFGGMFSTASGTFIRCTGGYDGFAGHVGTASGIFDGCVGGLESFGGLGGTASGTFTDCSGAIYSFGGAFGTVSGTFTRCSGGDYSFGGASGTASGTFTDCSAGDYSFGSSASGTSAVMRRCRSVGRSDAIKNWQGLMIDCEIEVTGTNKHAVEITGEARIYKSVLIANGTGNSVYAASAQNAKIAGILTNKAIGSNVTNLISSPGNVIDSDISL